ncbi:MAG: hypothetical protein ACOYPS_07240 [Phycisphaerales bacterium]
MIEKALILEGHDWLHEHAAMADVWMAIYMRGNDVGDPDFMCCFPDRRELQPDVDGGFFVVADMDLADGTRVVGTVAPGRDDAGEAIYLLAACFWPDGRSASASIHAADDHPSDPPERRDPARRRDKGRDRVLRALGRERSAVFPITVTPRAAIVGWERSWTLADVLPGRGMAWTARERPPIKCKLP